MNCRQAYRFICANLDERIESARCRALRKHIACCPNCRAYLDSVKKTVRLYRSTPGPRLPRAAHRDLMKALEIEMVRTPDHTRKATRRGSR
jgi:anti-sigma factor RsiW